jgi:hypothetical protein
VNPKNATGFKEAKLFLLLVESKIVNPPGCVVDPTYVLYPVVNDGFAFDVVVIG